MKKKIAAGFIAASVCTVFGAGNILAENIVSHEVKKRETLWGLSDGYLADPLLWPKVWKFNPKISNPNLIYPGQTVRIPGVEKTSVRTMPGQSGAGRANSGDSSLARAGMSSTSAPLAVTLPGPEQLPPEDNSQAGQDAAQVKRYDLGVGMITSAIPTDGLVLHTRQGWQKAALGETILISAPGAKIGQQFGVYRDMGEVKGIGYFDLSPGHLLTDLAIVEVVASKDAQQQAVVRRASAALQNGDLLGPVPEKIAVAPKPGQAKPTARGEVVAFHSLRQLAGPDDIIYLNIGANQGLAPGDVLAVSGAEQGGPRTSGEVMILRVAADTAAAVVTGRSGHEVHRGDVVGPPVL